MVTPQTIQGCLFRHLEITLGQHPVAQTRGVLGHEHQHKIVYFPSRSAGMGDSHNLVRTKSSTAQLMRVCVVIPFFWDVRLADTPAGVTQEEGHIGFFHFPSAVLALIFIARRIQPSLSLVDRNVEFCVPAK